MKPASIRFHLEPLADTTTLRVVADAGGSPVSCRAVLTGLAGDGASRSSFARALAGAPFEAFAWECRALFGDDLDAPMEMVAVRSPALAAHVADPSAFREHLASTKRDEVVVFENLGGDALLVVPRPAAPSRAYAHLATFLRSGPASQVDALLRATADAALARVALRDAPVFLSTSGLGVPWLHVRLDDRPKYYLHAPFRRAARSTRSDV